MPLMSRLPLVAVAGAACAALALPAVASAEIIEVGKVDPAPVPSCPDAPVPGGQPHHRLPGQDRPATRNLMVDPQGRAASSPGRSASASPARSRRRSSTTSSAASPGPDHRPQPAHASCARARSARATRRSSRRSSARTVQFPLAQVDPGQEGLGRRPDGAHVGARAGRRPRSRHVVAREPRQGHVRGHLDQTRCRRGANQLAQYYCLYRTARLAYRATLLHRPDGRGHAAGQPEERSALRRAAARSASRRRRARSAGDRAGGSGGPARTRCARGAATKPPQCGGRGTSAPSKRCSARPRRRGRARSRRGDDARSAATPTR